MPPKQRARARGDRRGSGLAAESDDTFVSMNAYLADGWAPAATPARLENLPDDLPQPFYEPEFQSMLNAFTLSWNAIWTEYHPGEEGKEWVRDDDIPLRAPYTTADIIGIMRSNILPARLSDMLLDQLPNYDERWDAVEGLHSDGPFGLIHFGALLRVLNDRHNMSYTLGVFDNRTNDVTTYEMDVRPIILLGVRNQMIQQPSGERISTNRYAGFTRHPSRFDKELALSLNTYINTRPRDGLDLVEQGLYRAIADIPAFLTRPRAHNGQFLLRGDIDEQVPLEFQEPQGIFNALIRPQLFLRDANNPAVPAVLVEQISQLNRVAGMPRPLGRGKKNKKSKKVDKGKGKPVDKGKSKTGNSRGKTAATGSKRKRDGDDEDDDDNVPAGSKRQRRDGEADGQKPGPSKKAAGQPKKKPENIIEGDDYDTLPTPRLRNEVDDRRGNGTMPQATREDLITWLRIFDEDYEEVVEKNQKNKKKMRVVKVKQDDPNGDTYEAQFLPYLRRLVRERTLAGITIFRQYSEPEDRTKDGLITWLRNYDEWNSRLPVPEDEEEEEEEEEEQGENLDLETGEWDPNTYQSDEDEEDENENEDEELKTDNEDEVDYRHGPFNIPGRPPPPELSPQFNIPNPELSPRARELYFPDEFEAETAEQKTQTRRVNWVRNRTKLVALVKSGKKLNDGKGSVGGKKSAKRGKNLK